MKTEEWELKDIKPYPGNAKLHNLKWISSSIRDFKPDQPIVVDSGGVIIKGHGRLEAAQSLGMKTFPVVVRDDLTPEHVRLARIADNRSSEAGWDTELLNIDIQGILEDMPDIDLDEYGMSTMFDISANEDMGGEAPEEFKEYDEDIKTEYCCPKCKYAWSGKPK